MTKLINAVREIFVAIYLRLSRDDQNGAAESMSIKPNEMKGARGYG